MKKRIMLLLPAFLLTGAFGCTVQKVNETPPPTMTLEALGVQAEYHNGERGLWALDSNNRVIWVAERAICFNTLSPMPVTKLEAGAIEMPSGRQESLMANKKCDVTCTCNDADGGCNPFHAAGYCGCAVVDPCTSCTRG